MIKSMGMDKKWMKKEIFTVETGKMDIVREMEN